MKYQANPVIVEAHQILDIYQDADCLRMKLDNGAKVAVTPEMIARMYPVRGDYYVVQEDSYIYLNPKDVFERKYSPITE